MTTNETLNPNIVSTWLKKHYDAGEEVILEFIKRDGTVRKMIAQKDQTLLETVQGIRTHSNPLTKVVTEKLPDGTFRFRSVPLDRVLSLGLGTI